MIIDGFDAAVHISEEATNAAKAVPTAMIGATISATVLGWCE
jgi:amino acid transporter